MRIEVDRITQSNSSRTVAKKLPVFPITLLSSGEVESIFLKILVAVDEGIDDDVTHAAAVSVGYATMGAMEHYMALILQKLSDAGTSEKLQYLLLTSFREVITLDYKERGVGASGSSGSLKKFWIVGPLASNSLICFCFSL